VYDIRAMTLHDLPLGMRLKTEAGWNQTEADWRRFLALAPDGGFVAELDRTPVATAMAFVFGPVAWVAMVLVDARVRGRGIGTALMTYVVRHLDGRGVTSIRLDATPLGQPVYEKLGFQAEYELARFAGVPPPDGPIDGVEPVTEDLLAEVIALDRALSGTDRGVLLSLLYQESPASFRATRCDGVLVGYLASRPGARAEQVGPCLALPEGGSRLLRDAWHRRAQRLVFLDVPVPNVPASRLAAAMGLSVQRRLLRMCRGPRIGEAVENLWASSGPEKG
jgi:GNAT superfamily N-acetyltransferase